MTVKKQIILFIILFVILNTTNSQQVVSNSQKGYYFSSSKLVNGIFIENENSNYRALRIIIAEQINHKAAVLTPDDIDEYGFENGLKYISSTIIYLGEEKKVFLKEVQKVNDSVSIYCYNNESKDVYYIKRKGYNGTVVSDSGVEIWELFRQETKCQNIQKKDIINIKLNDATINKLYRVYYECNLNLLQKRQFGVYFGIGICRPSTTSNYTTYKMGISNYLGVFMQMPLDEYFIFQPELLIYRVQSKDGFRGNSEDISWTEEPYIRYSLQLPLILRYNFNNSSRNIIPYIESGPLIDKNLYTSNIETNIHFGITIGTGFRYKLNTLHSINVGLRFIHLVSKVITYTQSHFDNQIEYLFRDEIKLNINSLNLNVSYNL